MLLLWRVVRTAITTVKEKPQIAVAAPRGRLFLNPTTVQCIWQGAFQAVTQGPRLLPSQLFHLQKVASGPLWKVRRVEKTHLLLKHFGTEATQGTCGLADEVLWGQLFSTETPPPWKAAWIFGKHPMQSRAISPSPHPHTQN